MTTNEIIEKKELGFFQKLRKNRLLRSINISKYRSAPEYLKYDEEVIEALLMESPYNIVALYPAQKMSVVEKHPELFNYIPLAEKEAIVKQRPEYISRLQEDEAYSFIFTDGSLDLIKYLRPESQTRLLTENVKYIKSVPDKSYNSSISDFGRSPTIYETNPKNFATYLNFFESEVVERVVISLLEQAKTQEGYTWKDKKNRIPFLRDIKIDNLPEETQLKLGLIDNDFLEKMSDDVALKFVGKNPMLIEKLKDSAKIKLIKENPELFAVLNPEKKKALLRSEMSLRNIIPDSEKIKNRYVIYDTNLYNDAEMVKRRLTEMRSRDFLITTEVTDYVRDTDALLNLARFEPDIFSISGCDAFQRGKKITHIIDLYKSRTSSQIMQDALDGFRRRMLSSQDPRTMGNSAKILLNEKVMNTCDPELIMKFLRSPDGAAGKEIIIATYGENARKILEDRPGITLTQIPNLDIFDEKVVKKFGIGTIHNMLSYDSYGAAVLGDLARDPGKMEKFDLFDEATKGYYQPTAMGFDQKLMEFVQSGRLLDNMSRKDLTPERKKNLMLYLNDSRMRFSSYQSNECETIPLETLEDLDSYGIRREEMYTDYMKKSTSPEDIKEAISRRFFGIEYGAKGVESRFRRSQISMRGMIYYYNLSKFLGDGRTQTSRLFTNDELDQLELVTIIDKIKDPEVLKQIYTKLAEQKKIIEPTDFAKVKEKVPLQYSKTLVDSLMTVEKAKQMIEKGTNGISYEKTEDGIEIIKLSGADFRIMIHTPGLNNSSLCLPQNMTEDELWKFFEEGCSTVSGCVIEPGMLYSCAQTGEVNFGFAKVAPEQIIGMSHHDAHVTHAHNAIDPYFEHGSIHFEYPEELVRKTAAQINRTEGEEKDVNHPYNEAAMYRKIVDPDKIEENTYGGKIMPDYLVVYGEANNRVKEMAKRFSKDGKPLPILEIDFPCYGDRSWERASKRKDYSLDRKKGSIVKEIEDLVKDNDETDR